MNLKQVMNGFLRDYLKENDIQFEDWSINVNNQDGFGDYSSNIALKLTKKLKKSPIKIANSIANHKNNLGDIFTVSASEPGFINFHISDNYYLKILDQILKKAENFGKKKKLNKSANVEFVSCNPTGPLNCWSWQASYSRRYGFEYTYLEWV